MLSFYLLNLTILIKDESGPGETGKGRIGHLLAAGIQRKIQVLQTGAGPCPASQGQSSCRPPRFGPSHPGREVRKAAASGQPAPERRSVPSRLLCSLWTVIPGQKTDHRSKPRGSPQRGKYPPPQGNEWTQAQLKCPVPPGRSQQQAWALAARPGDSAPEGSRETALHRPQLSGAMHAGSRGFFRGCLKVVTGVVPATMGSFSEPFRLAWFPSLASAR